MRFSTLEIPMRSSTLKLSTVFYLFLATALVSLAIGCGTPANTNTTANVNAGTGPAAVAVAPVGLPNDPAPLGHEPAGPLPGGG